LEPRTENFAHAAAYTAENFRVVEYVEFLRFDDLDCIFLTQYSAIGAGDTFIAGMLYGLNCHEKDWDLSRKLGFANRVAGMKVTQEGFSGLHRALES
jgi:ketohexokinase